MSDAYELHDSRIADTMGPDQRIEMRHAMVMVRTDTGTYVMSDVTGLLLLHMNIEESPEVPVLLADELVGTVKGADKLRDFSVNLSANTPGYVFLPNSPPEGAR